MYIRNRLVFCPNIGVAAECRGVLWFVCLVRFAGSSVLCACFRCWVAGMFYLLDESDLLRGISFL